MIHEHSGKFKLRTGLWSVSALLLCFVLSATCQETPDLLARARSLLDAGKTQEAETALRDELKIDPTSGEAHFLLGYILFREQKPTESLSEFTAGAKYKQPKADDLKIVASDYTMLGDFGDADKWFTQVIVSRPDDADTWYLLGRTKFSETNYRDAVTSFERALALRPQYVEAENNLGLSWKALGEVDKARASFQNAIGLQGETPQDAQPFFNLGALLADQNELDEALPLLKRAAAMAPDNPSIHEELGKAYTAKRDLADAQKEFEAAIALAPDVSSLHYKLAQIYRKEGLTAQAEKEFARCEQLGSTHSSTKTPNPPR
jgi:tetratricopeptide (TPR) repeat protein